MSYITRLLAAAVLLTTASTVFAAPVIVSTDSASMIEARIARVGATIGAPAGETVTWYIEYGTTTAFGKKSQSDVVDPGDQSTVSFSIINLVPSTTHYYRVRAKSSNGTTATGPTLNFTTIAAVAVDINATLTGAVLVPDGEDIDLDVTVNAGSYPLTYKWKRDGVLLKSSAGSPSSATRNFIYNVNADNLRINKVTSTSGGTYTCEVSNPDTPPQTTTGLVVTVVSTVPAPKNSSVNDIIRKEGETFSIKATLTPPNPAATFAWKAGTVAAMTGYGTVTGINTDTLTVTGATPLAYDSYVCDVTLGATTVTTDDVYVEVQPKPITDPISNMTVTVGELVSISPNISNNPTVTKVTGLPAGLSYSTSTRKITGKPLYPTGLDEPAVVVINASNNAGAAVPMAFTITVNPLDSDMVGSFDGLIERSVDDKNLGGQVSFTVSATGDVTGTLLLGVGRYPFKTKVTTDSGGGATLVELDNLKSGQLPMVDYVAIYIDTSGNLSGNCNAFPGYSGGIYFGARNPWAAHNPLLTAGLFNCALTPDGVAIANADLPHGHGFVSLTVSSLGVVTFTGKTSDGLVVTGKTSVNGAGVVPLFAVQSAGKASLYGAPTITNKDVAGTCDWKSVSRTGRVYKNGFDLHTLTVLGKRYVKPQAGLNEIILGLANTTLNARLEFSDGGLGSTVGQNFTLTNLNVVQMPSGLSNPNVVSMKLDLVSGLIEGKFSVKDTNPLPPGQQLTRTASFYGLVIPGTGEARGFFTLAKLPSSGPPASNTSINTSDMLSGIAVLKAPVP